MCSKCHLEKPLTPEFFSLREGGSYRNECKVCLALYRKKYRATNKETIKQGKKQYYEDNREAILEEKKRTYEVKKPQILAYKKQYYKDNREQILEQKKLSGKAYYEANKERKLEEGAARAKQRRKEDPSFRLRCNVSVRIHTILKGAVVKQSIIDYLGWTMEEGRKHIEALFSIPYNLTIDGKVWMSWENWGKYNATTWNDNDSTTWTWELDHKRPQASFEYTSMEDEAFKQCWSLENLRPYSAKQNRLESDRGNRHKKA